MPNGPRVRANNVYGTITDNPLAAAAGTFNSNSLPLLPVVSSAHAIVVFDPKRVYGDPEIVVVTAHTVGSTVASILRGQYGTSPRQHPVGTSWAHVPVNEDWTQILTSGSRPSDPYRGQTIFETDTNRYTGRSTADAWQQIGLFFDPPYCELRRAAAGTHTANGAWQAVTIDTEDVDTDNMFTITSPTRITVTRAGIYNVGGFFEFAGNATGRRFIGIAINGIGGGPTKGYIGSETDHLTASGVGLGFSRSIKLAATDFIELVGFQSSGGNLGYTAGTTHFYACWIGRGN